MSYIFGLFISYRIRIKMTTREDAGKLQGKIKIYFRDEVVFDSDFDSANLAAVVEIPKSEFDYEFNLWTAPDCGGTEYENPNRYT